MLNTIEQNPSTSTISDSSEQEANPETVLIAAQHYLDFKYGKMEIAVKLPDDTIATLIIGNQGKAFFQVAPQE